MVEGGRMVARAMARTYVGSVAGGTGGSEEEQEKGVEKVPKNFCRRLLSVNRTACDSIDRACLQSTSGWGWGCRISFSDTLFRQKGLEDPRHERLSPAQQAVLRR